MKFKDSKKSQKVEFQVFNNFLHVVSSVVNPDPHGSAFTGLSWIQILIGNSDQEDLLQQHTLTKYHRIERLLAVGPLGSRRPSQLLA